MAFSTQSGSYPFFFFFLDRTIGWGPLRGRGCNYISTPTQWVDLSTPCLARASVMELADLLTRKNSSGLVEHSSLISLIGGISIRVEFADRKPTEEEGVYIERFKFSIDKLCYGVSDPSRDFTSWIGDWLSILSSQLCTVTLSRIKRSQLINQ